MKWVPLTNDTLLQLRMKGYKHLVVKHSRGNETLNTDKEFITLEAVKDNASDDEVAFDIKPGEADKLVYSDKADYYVFFK